jgi:hypothetical protein
VVNISREDQRGSDTMNGTDQQIVWASSILADRLAELDAYIAVKEAGERPQPFTAADLGLRIASTFKATKSTLPALRNWLASLDDAAAIIDSFGPRRTVSMALRNDFRAAAGLA